MRPDEDKSSVELAAFRHIHVYIDVNISLSRCWWFIIVGTDSIVGKILSVYEQYILRRCYSLVCDLRRANMDTYGPYYIIYSSLAT